MKKIIYSKNKIKLITEMLCLYVALPVLLTIVKIKIPLVIVLAVLGIGIAIFIKFDPDFKNKKLFSGNLAGYKNVLLAFAIAATTMVLITYALQPSTLFYLPKHKAWLIPIITFFYPLFSVIPQGLAYRVLFYHRYASLFKHNWLKLVAAGVIFAFGHIIYKNAFVLGSTFLAGIVFAYRYKKTNSFWLSSLEHSLWGVFLFISGLGLMFVKAFVE